jgi:stage V sporulation protein R
VSEGWFFRGRKGLPTELAEMQVRVEELARSQGLDFCPVIYEVCDYDEINMIASYGGFPIRYPHWRFGMDYLQMQKGYEYGLQKIYEMVINTNPSYAYLLDNNTMMDQKLVMAHVCGHVDFFTHNAWFKPTNRKMLDQMANHAAKVRRIIDRVGMSTVEEFIDACLSIENLIDPHRDHIRRERRPPDGDTQVESDDAAMGKLPASSYMDKYINPPEALEQARQRREDQADLQARFPAEPVRDVMGFILKHGRMERWQQDVLGIIRDEAYYFAPQGRTKIMNEGWASYWHTTLMTSKLLDDSEVIDYADHHSGTVAMRPGQLNPYKLGLELYRDVEDRWNKGRFGKDWLDCDNHEDRERWDTGAGLGRQKIFEIRKSHNDITFVDEFLTPDFCERTGLFTYEYDKASGRAIVDSREFDAVKQKLLFMLTNHGDPQVRVTDGNHGNRGELELTHTHEGVDVQVDWASQTLLNLARLWGRPVHLVTQVDGKRAVLTHDGTEFKTEGWKRKAGAGTK